MGQRRPHVLLSAAMSVDGYLDDASSARLVLSGDADLDRVDERRARSDAILVGAQTVRSDDPRLLVRSAARRERRIAAGQPPSPRKVTITRSGDLDPRSRFFAAHAAAGHTTGGGPLPLVYAAPDVADELSRRLTGLAVVVPVPARARDPLTGTASATAAGTGAGSEHRIHAGDGTDGADLELDRILTDLARRGVARLMVEGGSRILTQFLAAGLADEFELAVAPIVVGDSRAPRLVADLRLPGRMTLAGVTTAGDVAVLRYLPRAGCRMEG